MKRVLKLISAFLFVLVYACNSEQVTLSYPSPSTSPILSRGESDGTSLPIDSKILLNASGGLSLVNEVFTYNGSTWTSGEDIRWTDTQTETTVTALYPTYINNEYTSGNLYAQGVLEDVLIAQKTLAEKKAIELQFKHLFSSLTLSIEPALEATIQDLALTTPVKVAQISPQDGSFTLSQETHTVLQSINGSSEYSFILPPCESCVLSLLISMKDGTSKVVTFDAHTFQSGTQYECNITSTDSRPGIRTAADLIDFSRLINGYTPYQNKKLTDFGEEIDGVMTYYLLEDISLTKGQCDSLQAIGYKKDKPFVNIFDGKGHTITGYIIPDKGFDCDFIGLFGTIDEGAVVKNLHLSEAQNTESTTYECVGGIAGKNTGIIQDCSVQNSTFYSRKSYDNVTGGICGRSVSYIINSYTTNNTYYRRSGGKTGDIAGDSNGFIINCYSYKNKHSTKSYNKAYSGGIAGLSYNGHIYNCYVYKASETSPTDWGALLGVYNGNYLPLIENFFYNIEDTYGSVSDHNNPEGTHIYDYTFKVNDTHICCLLNQWITANASLDSIYSFKRWKVADDGSACFQ